MLLKFCGLRRQEDVGLAARLGATHCGFVFHAGSPRCVDAVTVSRLESGSMVRVGVFTGQDSGEIARIMQEEGYVAGYEVVEGEPRATLEITLKYGEKKAKTIRGIRRISKPGLRIYAGKDELPRVLGGLGTAIVSTSNGVMTDRDARKKGIGGEVIAYIW